MRGGQARTKIGVSIDPKLIVKPIVRYNSFEVLGEVEDHLAFVKLRRTTSANLSSLSSPRNAKPLRRSKSTN